MSTKKCPLLGGKKCIEHQCMFWTHLVGMNPQTGQPTDEWNCALAWLPTLLIENANQVRKSAASTDKVATEVRKQHGTFLGALSEDARARLLNADPRLIENPHGSQ